MEKDNSTEYILHRVNKISDLITIPQKYGCEIDVRTEGSKLILNHDPYTKGDNLIDYLDEYKNGTLVLNIKEAGIEDDVLNAVRDRNLKNYFLLDVEFPYLYRASKNGEKNIAVRFSEAEPIQLAQKFINKLDWIWIDTNTKLPINKKNIETIRKFKSCLVCPERWGRPYDIPKYKKMLKDLDLKLNTVMTSVKHISIWEE